MGESIGISARVRASISVCARCLVGSVCIAKDEIALRVFFAFPKQQKGLRIEVRCVQWWSQTNLS